jgi:membrane associated rhomboid family serine protease
MSFDHPAEAPQRREPIVNAPLVVIVTAATLVLLHAIVVFSGEAAQSDAIYQFALIPERFNADQASSIAYPGAVARFLTLFSTGLLHVNWMHVLVNSAMLLAFGTPVARYLGETAQGASRFMLLFAASVLGGSLAYLWLSGPEAAAAVGASGGVSGLAAAAFMIAPGGNGVSAASTRFLGFTLAFALSNVLLAIIGPVTLGSLIAWQAHAGGYVAGAALMVLLAPKFGHLSPRQ